MKKTETIISIALLCLLSACFALWALSYSGSPAGLVMAALYCLLFGISLYRFWGTFWNFCLDDCEDPAPDDLLGPRSLRFSRRHPWIGIAFSTLLFHLALYFIAYVLDRAVNGYAGGLWDTLQRLWLRSDSPSYLGIAENWYVTQGDPRFHIVFFPLYPILIRICNFLFRNSFVSAMVLSNLFSVLSGIACYELAALDLPRKDALRSVKYMLLLPGAFFLIAPMTESLFLFLCLLGLYFMRKRRWFFACLMAALASFTRLPGVLLLVPVGVEMLGELCMLHRQEAPDLWKHLLKDLGCLLLGLSGILGYLLINLSVTGNAFTFLVYQKEHWSQSLSWFFNTAAYQTEYFFSWEARYRYGLFLPNLLACLGALVLFAKEGKSLRPSYQGYFLVYFAVTVGATWLLSGPRYLAVCYPLFPAMARIGEDEEGFDRALSLVCLLFLLAYMALYVLGYPVY